MCIQDYRLAKNARQDFYGASINAAVTTAVVPPASGRLSLVFAAADLGAVADDAQLIIGPLVNGVVYPLATITLYRPSVVLTIFELGAVLTHGLSVSNVGAGAVSYRIIDSILEGDAERVVEQRM